MKKKVILLAFITGLLAIVNYSCRKPADISSSLVTQSADANTVQSENDQTNDDVNNALSSVTTIAGKTDEALGGKVSICGVNITKVDSGKTKKITLQYDSTTVCNGRIRSGKITIQLIKGNYWKDMGAVVMITANHVKINYANGSTLVFNGTKTLKNVTGGNYITLFTTSQNTLTTQERMLNMTLTFDGSATAVWNSARLSSVTYDNLNKELVYSTNGDTTIGTHANTAMWGNTRNGASFVNYYTAALFTNTNCGLNRPTAGDIHHELNGTDQCEVIAGVDASGNSVSSGSPCSSYYGYKILWENARHQIKTYIRSYPTK